MLLKPCADSACYSYGDSTGRPTEAGLEMDAAQSWAHLAGRADIDKSKVPEHFVIQGHLLIALSD